jgi:hypothetical protein
VHHCYTLISKGQLQDQLNLQYTETPASDGREATMWQGKRPVIRARKANNVYFARGEFVQAP